jgi:hypothetical protein
VYHSIIQALVKIPFLGRQDDCRYLLAQQATHLILAFSILSYFLSHATFSRPLAAHSADAFDGHKYGTVKDALKLISVGKLVERFIVIGVHAMVARVMKGLGVADDEEISDLKNKIRINIALLP